MKILTRTIEYIKIHPFPVAVFLTALALRIIYLLLMFGYFHSDAVLNLFPDSQVYLRAARFILGVNVAADEDILMVGPGYPLYLAAFFKIFGYNAWPILIVQIIASGFASVFLYNISMILMENKKISLIAGMLSAVSLTSISLSVSIMTETLFFFMTLLAIYIFLKGLKINRWSYFIVTGVCIGAASLIRSVGIFFPVVIIVIALIHTIGLPGAEKKAVLIRSLAAALIIITVALSWSVRNLAKHDIFTVSETGVLAARNYLCARVTHRAGSDLKLVEIRDAMAEPRIIDGREETLSQRHDHAVTTIIDTFKEHPGIFITTFIYNAWENIGFQSTIHTLQLPRFWREAKIYSRLTSSEGKSYLVFYLTLLGFLFLLYDKRVRPALILASIYLYFAFLSGFTFWQGSRIFFPGQIAWTILVGITLYNAAIGMNKIWLHFVKKAR